MGSHHNGTRPSTAALVFTDPGTGELKTRTFEVRVIEGPDVALFQTLKSGTLFVGTDPENDVVLTDTTVSRSHLELQLRSDGVLAKDLGSTNGIRFEGCKVKEIVLAAGGTLQLGNTMLSITPRDEAAQLEPSERDFFGQMRGRCLAMRRLFAVLERVADSDVSVLIDGETGVGKELAARALHEESSRARGPFIVVDCAALPANLIGSELFGHVRGAFTGADRNRVGLIEQADRGTLFLDEIGELPPELQPNLLRVLESRQVRRLGDTTDRPVDFRLVAATNRDLEAQVDAGGFRADLFFRIGVLRVTIPPLRARREDIPQLVETFLDQLGRSPFPFSSAVKAELARYDWPGNVRELRNVVARAVALGKVEIESQPLSPEMRTVDEASFSLPFKEAKGRLVNAFERDYVQHLLDRHGGNVSAAAREAGIDRNYIHRLVKKHGLTVSRD